MKITKWLVARVSCLQLGRELKCQWRNYVGFTGTFLLQLEEVVSKESRGLFQLWGH